MDDGTPINSDCTLFKTASHVLLTFKKPMKALSSSVFNGGFQATVQHVLNLKVDGKHSVTEHPVETLTAACTALSLKEPCIGMMTAASMNSLRYATCHFGDFYFSSIVTSGLNNARRAGDPADVLAENALIKAGTINMVVVTNACLEQATLAEAIMIASEAKVVQIKSAKTGALATGTGTDAIAVIANPDGKPLDYVGKHVLAGEKLAESVITALSASIQRG